MAYHECLVARDVHPGQLKPALEIEERCREGVRVHGMRYSLQVPGPLYPQQKQRPYVMPMFLP